MAIRRAYRKCCSASPLVTMTTEETSGTLQSRLAFRAWAAPGAERPSPSGPAPSSGTAGRRDWAVGSRGPLRSSANCPEPPPGPAGIGSVGVLTARLGDCLCALSASGEPFGGATLPAAWRQNLANPQDELRDLGIGVRKPLPEFVNLAVLLLQIPAELL